MTIGNANIEGLSDDLGLTGTQYNIALSIFFIPYVICGECSILVCASYPLVIAANSFVCRGPQQLPPPPV